LSRESIGRARNEREIYKEPTKISLSHAQGRQHYILNELRDGTALHAQGAFKEQPDKTGISR